MTEGKRPKQECLCHKSGVGDNLTNFTSTSLNTFKNAAAIRKDDIDEKLKHTLDGEPYGSYHCQRYQQYINKKHLERLQRKRMQEDNPAPETASTSGLSKAGGKVRSVSRLSSTPVLPKLCIICTKEHKTDKKSTARYESLTTCEFFEAVDLLLEAARLHKDERIVLSIQNQDYIAIELQYYRSCYCDYTNKKSLDILKKNNLQKM